MSIPVDLTLPLVGHAALPAPDSSLFEGRRHRSGSGTSAPEVERRPPGLRRSPSWPGRCRRAGRLPPLNRAFRPRRCGALSSSECVIPIQMGNTTIPKGNTPIRNRHVRQPGMRAPYLQRRASHLGMETVSNPDGAFPTGMTSSPIRMATVPTCMGASPSGMRGFRPGTEALHQGGSLSQQDGDVSHPAGNVAHRDRSVASPVLWRL